MFWCHLLGVSCGAAIGATLRWGIASALNGIAPDFPLGTLLCNLIGGLAVGIALAVFLAYDWSDGLRLFVMTGLLGGLTTFSAFSGEVSMLLIRGDYLLGTLLAGSHLVGSLLLTIVGFMLTRWAIQ